MSASRNFRVSVNLSHFFSDHRQRVRIFINEDFQQVEDIQSRIGTIFSLSNFYLTSSLNEYLPPCEDVRILQNDETICVVPVKVDQSFPVSSNTERREASLALNGPDNGTILGKKRKIPSAVDELLVRKQKKKKRDKHEQQDNTTQNISYSKYEQSFTSNDVPLEASTSRVSNFRRVQQLEDKSEEKKRKKNKKTVSEEVAVMEESTTKSAKLSKKKSKSMKYSNEYPEKEISVTENSKCDNSEKGDTSRNTIDIGKTIAAKEKPLCKGDLTNYTRKQNLPTNTEEYLKQKQINIVQVHVIKNGIVPYNTNQVQTEDDIVNTEQSLTTDEITPQTKQNQQIDDIAALKQGSNQSNVPNAEISLSNGDSGEVFGQNNIPNIYSVPNEHYKKSLIRNTTPLEFASESIEMENKLDAPTMPKESDDSNLFLPRLLKPPFKKRRQIFHTPERYKIDTVQINSTDVIDTKLSQNNEEKEIAQTPHCTDDSREYKFMNGLALNSVNKKKDSTFNSSREDPHSVSDKQPDSGVALSEPSIIVLENSIEENPVANLDCPEIKILHCVNDDTNSKLNECSNNSKVDEQPAPNNCGDAQKFEVGDTYNALSPIQPDTNNSVCSVWSTVSSAESTMDIRSTASDMSGLHWLSGQVTHAGFKGFSGVGKILDRLRGSSPTNLSTKSSCVGELERNVSIETNSNEACHLNVSKRKRHRRRQRKSKTIRSEVEVVPPQKPSYPQVHRNVSLQSVPNSHIKFVDDPDDSSLMIVDAHSVTIDSEPEEFVIREENILKSPLMDTMLPKEGDLVSFKILQMNEDYTPQVSPYITGKVKAFNPEDKNVTFEIINGLAYFEIPKGKLTVDMEEEEGFKDNVQELTWPDLIEPRLLYP